MGRLRLEKIKRKRASSACLLSLNPTIEEEKGRDEPQRRPRVVAASVRDNQNMTTSPVAVVV